MSDIVKGAVVDQQTSDVSDGAGTQPLSVIALENRLKLCPSNYKVFVVVEEDGMSFPVTSVVTSVNSKEVWLIVGDVDDISDDDDEEEYVWDSPEGDTATTPPNTNLVAVPACALSEPKAALEPKAAVDICEVGKRGSIRKA